MRVNYSRLITSVVLLAALSPIAMSQQGEQITTLKEKPKGWYLKPEAVQREVSFKTEDGWTIYGTYTVPNAYKPGTKLPAALLLHATHHHQSAWMNYTGWVKFQSTAATLRIDWRGRGKSDRPISFVDFSQAEREKVSLDVKAALDFLASQKEVDSTRLSIAAEEFVAAAAIKSGMEDPRVRAFVLLSGLLDQRSQELIAGNLAKPILYVVSKEDKRSFDDMTSAYNSSKAEGSEIWVEDGLGVGLAMGSVWRNRHLDMPMDKAIDHAEAEWLQARLQSLGHLTEVTLNTDDGWTLYANLRMPDIEEGKTVPGVVMLPTALADRSSFIGLERAMVGQGIAVLDLEWRGIGRSIGKGNYIGMTLGELAESPKDVHLGLKFLASQKGVDPENIGVLGAAFSAQIAFFAAKQNPKFKAVAMLTPVIWPWEADNNYAAIAKINRPVLLVSGTGYGDLTKKFADLTAADRRNKVILYPGAIFGYVLFRDHKDLEGTLAQWFKEQLVTRR
jgi:dienelactone hydrolase